MLYMIRKYGLAILNMLMVIGISQSANAITLLEPGFTETTVASLPSETAFGSITTGATGDVFLTEGYGGEITKVTPGGTVSNLLTIPGTSLALQRIGNTLFAGNSSGQIYAIDLTNPAPTATLLGTSSGEVNGLTQASAGFGAYGGDLIIASQTGLSSMNITTGALTGFSRSGTYSDVAFDGAGRLIAANNGAGIEQISDVGGLVGTILSGSGYDGLAISGATGDIFAANPGGGGTITRIDGTTFGSTVFATGLLISGGYYPSGIGFSPDSSSLYFYERAGGINEPTVLMALRPK